MTDGLVAQPLPYTCKHGCERDMLKQAFAEEAQARIATALEAQAARIAELEAAIRNLSEPTR